MTFILNHGIKMGLMGEKEASVLAQNLKRQRQFKGLTQKELGLKVGLAKDTISKLELGKQENIGMKYLYLICRELDISMEKLFVKDFKYIPFELVISDENIGTVRALLKQILFVLGKISEKEGPKEK